MTVPPPVPAVPAEPVPNAVLPPNVFSIRTWRDFVAMTYAILPVIQFGLVGYGVLDDVQVALWIAAGMSVCQVALQFTRTADFARRVIYTTFTIANSALVIYVAGWDAGTLDNFMPLFTILLGAPPAIVAVQNTNTSPPAEELAPATP